jgi:hypothetical protein
MKSPFQPAGSTGLSQAGIRSGRCSRICGQSRGEGRFPLPARHPLLHFRHSINFVVSTMSSQSANVRAPEELFRNSSLYREFQAEREEILRHKWIESEKAGHDIGFERALTDWILKHRSKWRKTRQGPSSKR